MTQTQKDVSSSQEQLTDSGAPSKKPKHENVFITLLFNILLPTLILIKLSSDQHFGPSMGVVVALSFPIGYGVYDYFKSDKVNFISVLGVISVGLTGGFSLLELDPKYIAYKEAGVPFLIGTWVLLSLKTKRPLIKMFLYSDLIFKTALIDEHIEKNNNKQAFDQVIVKASWMLAGSFLLSAVLNYVLAVVLLVSPPGTEAYNAELGKMTALSYPFIALPATIIMAYALFYFFKRIKTLSQLDFEDFLNSNQSKK